MFVCLFAFVLFCFFLIWRKRGYCPLNSLCYTGLSHMGDTYRYTKMAQPTVLESQHPEVEEAEVLPKFVILFKL